MSTKKKPVLSAKKANVTLYRQGLTIEVREVPYEDSGLAAKELLDMMRTLVKAGYEELVPDLGGLHGGTFGTADDGDYEQGKKKRIGF